MGVGAVVREVWRRGPDVVMTGHAGSTPAHPTCARMLRAIKARSPGVVTVAAAGRQVAGRRHGGHHRE